MAFALGIQKEWLPQDFIKSIPRSTYHGWKNESLNKYIGYKHAAQINDNVEELKVIFDKRVAKEKQLFLAYTRLKITLFQILGKETLHKAFKENSDAIVRAIENTKDTIKGGARAICAYLCISHQSYRYWRTIAKARCSKSMLGICIKKVPGQATYHEIQTMDRLLNRKRFAHWPICSVWAYAIRNNHLNLSLSSWYRYNKKYEFRSRKKKPKFKKQFNSLSAPTPNHTWHADITIVKTLDGKKHYVYLIVDNHSKFIINWKVSDKCNGKIRTQTIREAVKQEFGQHFLDYNENHNMPSVDLIVDGGAENNNKTVEGFIKRSQVSITKKIALKDIIHSNAHVEATNSILKHRYLFKQPLFNRKHLDIYLESAIEDFCYKKPHNALGLYTPHEVHSDTKPKIDLTKLKQAVKERRTHHQTNGCSACEF
jgi:putative transposase